MEIRKVGLEDFPNHKKKLVVQNIPLDVKEDEIMKYFYTILSQTTKENYAEPPITDITRYTQLGFVTLDFRKRQDADIILLLDDVKEFSPDFALKMRIFRVKRFIDQWNNTIDSGVNPCASLIQGLSSNFQQDTNRF